MHAQCASGREIENLKLKSTEIKTLKSEKYVNKEAIMSLVEELNAMKVAAQAFVRSEISVREQQLCTTQEDNVKNELLQEIDELQQLLPKEVRKLIKGAKAETAKKQKKVSQKDFDATIGTADQRCQRKIGSVLATSEAGSNPFVYFPRLNSALMDELGEGKEIWLTEKYDGTTVRLLRKYFVLFTKEFTQVI